MAKIAITRTAKTGTWFVVGYGNDTEIVRKAASMRLEMLLDGHNLQDALKELKVVTDPELHEYMPAENPFYGDQVFLTPSAQAGLTAYLKKKYGGKVQQPVETTPEVFMDGAILTGNGKL